MNNLKKKMLLLGLTIELTAMSLIGCGDNSHRIRLGNSTIVYEEDNSRMGTVRYEDADKYLKVVTAEIDGLTKKILLVKIFYHSDGRSTDLDYIDFETGALIKKYLNEESISLKEIEKEKSIIGEEINFIKEESLSKYLFISDNIKEEYDINELIAFFNEKIKNKEISEKTLKKN